MLMNQLEIFKNEEFGQVRTVIENSKILFCGSDVAKALGYSNSRKAIIDHCKGVTKRDTLTNGGMQSLSFISEGDLYRLIANSKLPSAEKFERWVFDEVLPIIRKHGMYATDELLDNPDLLISVATKLKEEKERNKQLEEKIQDDKPKVLFSEAVENSEDLISVKEMATIITQSGFKIGQNEMFEYLRKHNYLCSKKGSLYHLPTKKYEHLFKVTKRTIQGTESIHVRNTPKINGKGQLYFIKKFAEYKLQGLTFKDLLRDMKEERK
jgi:prophage antirepressor-like protein